ncbi:MAG TPA: hypothetical protein VNA31_09455 [bacterium]|nr:hypothetical protein [bacterium]
MSPALRLIAVLDVLACLGGACRAQHHDPDAPPSPPASTANAQTVKAQRAVDTLGSVQDHSALIAHVSDARLLVIAADGKRAGLDTATGEEVREIPESGVDEDASGDTGPLWTVAIDRPAEGTYRLIVVSPDQRSRQLTVNIFGTDGTPQPRIRVPLDFQKTRRAEFRLDFRKTPGSTSRLERVDPGGPND